MQDAPAGGGKGLGSARRRVVGTLNGNPENECVGPTLIEHKKRPKVQREPDF